MRTFDFRRAGGSPTSRHPLRLPKVRGLMCARSKESSYG